MTLEKPIGTPAKKASVLGGYLEGSVISTTLELFVDNTYLVDNGIGQLKGRWENANDSFLLFDDGGEIAASIYKLQGHAYKQNYRALDIMIIQEFLPPKIIQFPKN